MVSVQDLPRCKKPSCGGLLRPHVVWFGENLDEQVVTCKKIPLLIILLTNPLKVLDAAHEELEECDLCLVVGTSSVVYPAAMFAPQVTKIWINKCLAWAFYLMFSSGCGKGGSSCRIQHGDHSCYSETWRTWLFLPSTAYSSDFPHDIFRYYFSPSFRDPVEQPYPQH